MQKVLIITYYWPPAGGPGVQRWLKFVNYLPSFEIEPVVYVPENPQYPLKDEALLEELPENTTIIRQKIFEPYRLAGVLSSQKTSRISSGIIQDKKKQSFLEKALLWIRGNLFIPDARKFWIKPSVRYLSKYIKKEGITTVITTGPPHSVHLIGLRLKESLGVHWLADFRDPWTSIGYHKKLKLGKRARNKHRSLEKLVLNSADKIVVTSPSTRKEFELLTSKPIKVITNGYEHLRSNISTLDKKFTISHIGSLLTGRNPENLWAAIAELVKTNSNFRKALKIQIIGVCSDQNLQSISACNLKQYVEVIGYLPHKQALKAQQKSQVLLLIEINSVETQGIIPGKLFEYMAAKRPILAIGPENWDVGPIILETSTGVSFNYGDKEGIKQQLLQWFTLYETQNLQVTVKNLERYSRKELAKEMAKFIAWA